MSRSSSESGLLPSRQRPRIDSESEALLGGKCENCGAVAWPQRAGCYRCGVGPIAHHVLPREGRLISWTTVWVPVEGIHPPYTLALVEIGDARIFGHLRGSGEPTVGALVRVRTSSDAVPNYFFEMP